MPVKTPCPRLAWHDQAYTYINARRPQPMRLSAIDRELARCRRELGSMAIAPHGDPDDHEPTQNTCQDVDPSTTERIISTLVTGLTVQTYEWKKSNPSTNTWTWDRKPAYAHGPSSIGEITIIAHGVVQLRYEFDFILPKTISIHTEVEAAQSVSTVLQRYSDSHGHP